MSFQQGLSGLNAASRGLEVIGNNIANANTIGAKASRAEFADIYAASTNTASENAVGIGVSVASVTQSFTQGSINVTGNDLDMAINGNGFYQLTQTDGATSYTRNGEFKLDKNGYIVNTSGSQLMGFATDTAGKRVNNKPVPLQLPTGAPIAPNKTSAITAELNLNSATPVATSTTPVTTIGTSLTGFDSQGAEVPISLYFTKTATANTWDVYTSVNGSAPAKQGSLEFDADGVLKQTLDATGAGTGTKLLDVPMTTSGGALSTWSSSVDFSNSTQLGTAFGVTKLQQDGWAPGQLTNVKVDNTGTITARYSNGQSQAVGQVMLANFRNVQGLGQIGGGAWIETASSGQATRGAPGDGNLGALQSGALEESNVDLTAELVNMMTAQRSYQANAQTIKTQDQLLTTLVNLK